MVMFNFQCHNSGQNQVAIKIFGCEFVKNLLNFVESAAALNEFEIMFIMLYGEVFPSIVNRFSEGGYDFDIPAAFLYISVLLIFIFKSLLRYGMCIPSCYFDF